VFAVFEALYRKEWSAVRTMKITPALHQLFSPFTWNYAPPCLGYKPTHNIFWSWINPRLVTGILLCYIWIFNIQTPYTRNNSCGSLAKLNHVILHLRTTCPSNVHHSTDIIQCTCMHYGNSFDLPSTTRNKEYFRICKEMKSWFKVIFSKQRQ
jgi:hypothetical protein